MTHRIQGTASTAARGRAAKDAYKRERMALFADVLSDIGEVKATCRRIGISENTGTAYMAQMRRELGQQAA